MPWLELSLPIERPAWPRVERALSDLGALSVTLTDPEDAAPILEPAPGRTPLWRRLVVAALFPAHADRRGLTAVLTELLPWLSPGQIEFNEVADADWTRAWMDQFQPMRFGRRLWIYPSTHEPPADTDAVVVRLDPGLAFGTGTHPTTAQCLEWLDRQDLGGASVLDYGCGSGVLAVAALKLGAARAVGVDNDPQALGAARANAERNGVLDRLALCAPDAFEPTAQPFQFVVANILAGALVQLAPTLCDAAGPGAGIALSGILAGQEAELIERYRPWCEALETRERDGWVLITARRLAGAGSAEA